MTPRLSTGQSPNTEETARCSISSLLCPVLRLEKHQSHCCTMFLPGGKSTAVFFAGSADFEPDHGVVGPRSCSCIMTSGHGFSPPPAAQT